MSGVPDIQAQFRGLEAETDGKLRIIRFNVPRRKNAITHEMYKGLHELLKEAAEDQNVSIVAITGTGDFFSSGNDFGHLMNITSSEGSPEEAVKEGLTIVQDFIDILIDFPKPIIAVVNGSAVGVAVTMLALMDAVYATDNAWLHTPFTQMGLCPEACSSLTYPRLMGTAKASELLLFNKKISTTEACKLGLVTEVYPASTFQSDVWPKLKEMSELPPLSLKYGKQLCRDIDRGLLHQVNKAEIQRLAELSLSEETTMALINWFSRKSKL